MDNNYIYKNVLPGRTDQQSPYGNTTYYSAKVIFKSVEERVDVASIPVKELKAQYSVSDIANIHTILSLLSLLKSDMYDDALLPVGLGQQTYFYSSSSQCGLITKICQWQYYQVLIVDKWLGN